MTTIKGKPEEAAAAPRYDPNVCKKNIENGGNIPCDNLNLKYHCDSLTGVDGDYHQQCVDAGVIYFQIQVWVCHNTKTNQWLYFPPSNYLKECKALFDKDPNWEFAECRCCCACFAKETLIAVPAGYAEIYTIPVGAEVLTASVKGGGKPQWSNSVVKLSMGTGQGPQPMMVYIGFGTDQAKDLICTQDQPFLLSSGKFTTAARLVPGDQLVDKEGNAVDIVFVSMGTYDGAVHHIAAGNIWNNDPDGHLLLAGGVVAGDFEFQLNFDGLPDKWKVDDYDTRPRIGTPEYDQAMKKDIVKDDVFFHFNYQATQGPDGGKKRTAGGLFTTYRRASSPIPVGAQSLFTNAQATDILQNGKFTSLADPMAQINYDTVVRQLQGSYPDIVFYYDAFELLPQVYAFEAYGQKIVVVNGGLARLIGLQYEGLAMAMGHGVGCFYGGDPKVVEGYTAVGQADRYAFGVVKSRLWVNAQSIQYVIPAIDQWEYMFSLIAPENAGGNPLDPLHDPSIACRTTIIESAPFGGGLPECAGGPPLKKIQLQLANATSLMDVALTFSLALDPLTSDDPKNYVLDPLVEIVSATRNPNRDFVVDLKVKALTPGTTYTVTAHNLKSALGTGMDPQHDSTTFTAPDK